MSRGPEDLFDCDRVSALLESYLQGEVPPPERRAMRLHIHSCAECHAKVVARDPLQIFAPLSDEERGEEFWAGFWPAIRADIHAAEAESRSIWSWLRRPAFAWGAATVMMIVAAVAVMRGGRTAPTVVATSAGPAARAVTDAWMDVLPSAGRPGDPTPPTVEDVRSPSAKVLTMKVYGADQAVTEVVLIVDEGLNL